jgi:hypothetical protein
MPVMKRIVLGALATVALSACAYVQGPLAGGGQVAAAPHTQAAKPPVVGGCQVFPSNNAWNEDVSKLPVRKDSAQLIRSISAADGKTKLHADFGGGGKYGIPFIVVPKKQKAVPVHYTAYGDESSHGPFPIPPRTPIEGGRNSDGDRHAIALQSGTCHLFELYRAFWRGNHWDADSGVNWNLKTNPHRPRGWTSADAAGLPIFPGLARYSEVHNGAIHHALRFTVAATQRGFIAPATHEASSSNNKALPPMGLRLRLKASYSLKRFHGQSLVILKALKTYGMIVADNGSSWYISGASSPKWNDNDLDQLKTVPGAAFVAVNTGPIQH